MNAEEIEPSLIALLEEASKVFTASEVNEVRHFVDQGEYGIALDTAVSIYAEERRIASSRAAELVRTLAQAMDMDVAELDARLVAKMTRPIELDWRRSALK